MSDNSNEGNDTPDKILTDIKINQSIWNAIFAKLNPSKIDTTLLDLTKPADKAKYDIIKQIESLHLRTYPINDLTIYTPINSVETDMYDKFVNNTAYSRDKETENEALITNSAKPILNASIQTLLRNMLENGVDFEPTKQTLDDEDIYVSRYYTKNSEYKYVYKFETVEEKKVINVFYSHENELHQLLTFTQIMEEVPYLPNTVIAVIIEGEYYETTLIDDEEE